MLQASVVLKCPTCNTKHHPKTDVFCNNHRNNNNDEDEEDGGKRYYNDYDARQLFGITWTCPITLEECSNLVVLPCGHVLSQGAYHSLGGYLPRSLSSRVSSMDDESVSHDTDDDTGSSSSILVHIRHAGQAGVNGTYRKHYHKNNSGSIDSSSNNNNNTNNRYTSIGRYNYQDVEYCIDLRTVTTGGASSSTGYTQRMWYLSCHPLGTKKKEYHTTTTSTTAAASNNDSESSFKTIDFYKGRVNECMYPHHILWEPASLAGLYPAPQSAISHFV